jgi:hypothetical protein
MDLREPSCGYTWVEGTEVWGQFLYLPSGGCEGKEGFDILNYPPVPLISTSDKRVSTSKAKGRNFV